MTQKTKELFEALNLLRYSASHDFKEITENEIQDAYYKIFNLIASLKYIEDQNEAIQLAEQEKQKRFEEIHKKVLKNFDGIGAVEIAQALTDKMNYYGIRNSYVVSEMSNGKIGIIEGTSAENKQIIRIYDDYSDYYINIEEDIKCGFKREKYFSNIKKLSKNKKENIE